MSLDKMPIFAWYALVTSLMILTGFPPLILGSILLEVERAFGLPFFQADLGGDSLLWQHLFWLFGHPEVYIIFLPAAGVISTILPVMARTTLLGYGWIVASAVALAFLSFGLWVHHMFTTGIPHMGLAFFSAASTLVAVPTGVQVFAWIGTLWKGRPELHLPMLHLLGFLFTFVIGGLTGVMVAVVPFDWQAHDTAFITAHLHYVLFGGFVFPILAGIYYWLPLFTGRTRFFKLGEMAFVLIFLGFHGTFLAMHWVGLMGQRRRIDTYDVETGWSTINLISSVSSFIMAIGLAMVLVDIILHVYVALRGRRDPWKSGTLEWAMMAPPPAYNFASLPRVTSRAPLPDISGLANRLARGEGYLGNRPAVRRETLAVDISSGQPDYLVVYPGNTALPIVFAAVTGLFFLSLLIKFYWLTPLAVLGMMVLALVWVWRLGAREDSGLQEIGHGDRVPMAGETSRSPGWWGSAFLLVANGTFFGSLLFGYAFLWTVAPGWPPSQWLEPSVAETIAVTGGALVAVGAMRIAARHNRRGGRGLSSTVIALMGTLAVAAAIATMLHRMPSAGSHAYAATLFVLGSYVLFHAILCALMQANLFARIVAGYTSPHRRAEFAIVALWADYLAVIAAIGVAAAQIPGMLA
jgi:cytochrome c oxidase subunit I+III